MQADARASLAPEQACRETAEPRDSGKVRRFPRTISRAEAERAVKDAGGNKRLAARQLGISRTSLYTLLGMGKKGGEM